MENKKLVTNDQIPVLFKEAIERNKVVEFLSGKGEYVCPAPYSFPVKIPTDFERILIKGIYPIFDESDENTKNEIISKYKEGIFCLLSGTPDDFWIGYMICWYQSAKESKKTAPFKAIDAAIVEAIKANLYKNTEELKKLNEWAGLGRKGGLYSHIISSNDTLKTQYGVSLL